VVELVTMTLIAEGLNYMKKLRWLLDSNPEKSDAHAASEPIPCPTRKHIHEAYAYPALQLNS
jgi:hypothetical protein